MQGNIRFAASGIRHLCYNLPQNYLCFYKILFTQEIKNGC